MNPEFQRNHFSRTAKGIYRLGHKCIKLMKWMAWYERFFDNINFLSQFGLFYPL